MFVKPLSLLGSKGREWRFGAKHGKDYHDFAVVPVMAEGGANSILLRLMNILLSLSGAQGGKKQIWHGTKSKCEGYHFALGFSESG